ncbi:MAG: 4-hydroxythreonine-4-phosphate dehydrogenase PdxA [Burkholderiaceae bacterium]
MSIGDPAGIGPEIALKASIRFTPPTILVGDAAVLEETRSRLGMVLPPQVSIQSLAPSPASPACQPGLPGAHTGQAAWLAITTAVALVQNGTARAITTAPIAKSALRAAGHQWPGHTELLADLAGGVEVRMMLANPELRVVLVTVHQSLRSALDSLSTELIEQTIRIADRSLKKFGITRPRLAVAGVNPHAGEGGLFGEEEIRLVAPAVAAACADGICASGPFAPDTIFMRARGLDEFDAVIAMYHDQGLIPVKYLGIEDGVNVTLGLPFVRTSPDHGTAFDIAGTGTANETSMLAALTMADQLAN